MRSEVWPQFIVVMGVSGTGKSSVGAALSHALAAAFIEGDSFHPPDNIAAMSAGRPLTDAMRLPWLGAICDAALGLHAASGVAVVIACSALKRRYRDMMRARLPGLRFVHLDGDPETIRRRLEARPSHFMPPSLLATQIADLERPDADEAVVAVDIDATEKDVVAAALARLRPANGAPEQSGEDAS